MTDSRIADVVLVVTGKASLDEVAQRHGVTRAEVELWKQAYVAGLEGAVAGRRSLRRVRWPVALLGVLAVVGLASRISFASGSTCGVMLPGTITPFCPDSPAVANELNNNYTAVISWIETKIGSISSADLPVAGNANVVGAVSTSRLNLNTVALGVDGGVAGGGLANDSTSGSIVVTGRGAQPDRKITLQDDVTVTGDLAVNGRITSAVSGTIIGGGQLGCLLFVSGNNGQVTGCLGNFGAATCPMTASPCSTTTRVTCPAGSTARDTERNCASPGGLPGTPYACFTTSWCVRD